MMALPNGYEYLLSDEVQKRQVVLHGLSFRPTGDPRVLPYIEQMLEDKRPCVISLPHLYAEVRFRAAEALAAERKAQGINEPVRLSGVVIPINHNKLAELARAAGLSMTAGWQVWFERLREMEQLPVEDFELEPESFVP